MYMLRIQIEGCPSPSNQQSLELQLRHSGLTARGTKSKSISYSMHMYGGLILSPLLDLFIVGRACSL